MIVKLARKLLSKNKSPEKKQLYTRRAKAEALHLLETTIANEKLSDPKSLASAYSQIYSQYGEDGIISDIFSRIGTKYQTFLEIGAENGLQNTTRFLLEQGWSGVWVEGNSENCLEARSTFEEYIALGRLKIIEAFVEPRSINEILDRHEVDIHFDYICVDIDQNTNHVWRALNRTARVSCIEYNASIPPTAAVEVPYVPGSIWDGSNYFGAGLSVMELIGRAKKMSLVGCDLQGVNAFFVDARETGDKFTEPFDAVTHYRFPQYAMFEHLGHPPSQTARIWQIAEEATEDPE